MRITAGEFSGRVLKTPKNSEIRPTSDKVRQAIFNMLNARNAVENAIVIDAFCGTGALGLEALSQGASFCCFIDKNRKSLELCKKNIQELGLLDNRVSGLCLDSTKNADKPDDINPATLIFFDPPYQKNLISKSYDAFFNMGWIAPSAFIVCETSSNEANPLPMLELLQEKIYGDTRIQIFKNR